MADVNKNLETSERYSKLLFVNDSENHGKHGFKYSPKRVRKRNKIIILTLISIMAAVCLVTGMVLIFQAIKKCKPFTGNGNVIIEASGKEESKLTECQYSKEAKRVKLEEFLEKVQSTYYKLFAENTAWHPLVTIDMIRKEYITYNSSPGAIKRRTDTAHQLLEEISSRVSTIISNPLHQCYQYT